MSEAVHFLVQNVRAVVLNFQWPLPGSLSLVWSTIRKHKLAVLHLKWYRHLRKKPTTKETVLTIIWVDLWSLHIAREFRSRGSNKFRSGWCSLHWNKSSASDWSAWPVSRLWSRVVGHERIHSDPSNKLHSFHERSGRNRWSRIEPGFEFRV